MREANQQQTTKSILECTFSWIGNTVYWIPTGVAILTANAYAPFLAAKFNIPFLIGGAYVDKLPGLRKSGEYITWAIIGVGIGNVLLRLLKNLCKYIEERLYVYSKEDRAFENYCSAI